MSFNFNGTTWTPVTAQDASNDLLNRINTILASNNITNFLKPIISNVVWIFCLAAGQVISIFQQLLFQAQNVLNLATCSDQQVIDILPIVGTQLITATKTTVWLKVVATSGGACVVPDNTEIKYNSAISFFTLGALTVLASQTGYVQAECNTTGLINVTDGQFTSFVPTITNLSSVINGTFTISGVVRGTVLGRDLETATQVRQRILNGNIIDNSLNGFIRALQGINGLGGINVIYNSDNANPLPVTTTAGVIDLPPRQMWIITQGADLSGSDLANAWFNNSLIQTYNSLDAIGTTQVETITTLNLQTINVYYDIATSQDIWVQVSVPSTLNPLSTDQKALANALILNLNSSFTTLGQQITAIQIDSLFTNFTSFRVYGTLVSLTGAGYAEFVNVNANAVPVFSDAKIVYNYI